MVKKIVELTLIDVGENLYQFIVWNKKEHQYKEPGSIELF